MEGDELALFERTLRAAVASVDVDAALVEAGWHDALADDPRAAVSVLFEAQGEANATSSALDHVLLFALGVEGDAAVLPPGIGTSALRAATKAVVVASSSVVPVSELHLRPVQGLDPALGLVEVSGPADLDGPVPALGRLALGHELVGAARTMLALARDHALEREQFGRPISQFQAVRHRLAEALVAIETAGAALDAAWDSGCEPGAAAMAKALAGRGARTAARHCQQVLAGIGFTTEHVLHRYVRRVLVLDQLLGSSASLTRELGEELLRTRRLPPLQPL